MTAQDLLYDSVKLRITIILGKGLGHMACTLGDQAKLNEAFYPVERRFLGASSGLMFGSQDLTKLVE